MFRYSIVAILAIASTASAGDKAPTVLRVATRELPSRFTPHGPLTDVDRQASDLLFEPLVAVVHDADGSIRHRPVLAESIPSGQGVHLTFRLRPGAVWSNGEPITADDVRNALQNLREDGGAEFGWATLIDKAEHGSSPREIAVSLRHGLVNPWECFTFPLGLQKKEGGPQLGSGPFVLGDPIKDGVRFVKNLRHPAAGKIPFDEVHWFAAKDAKDLDRISPDLTLGFDAAGSRTVKTSPTRRVWYVAPNHRHPLLGQPELRTFLSTALDRNTIVGKRSVNGLTPRDSWAEAPKPRVPEELHAPAIARGMAAKLAAAHKSISLTFKFPADQAALMSQVVDQWQAAAKAGGLNLTIQPIPLTASDLAAAIAKHDFDLALVHEDHGDSLARLAALFDQRPIARSPGGSNVLGVEDSVLNRQIASLPLTRQFPSLREQMRNLHVHLFQTMTVIPLWQDQAHSSLGPNFHVDRFDPLRPFADVTTWKK